MLCHGRCSHPLKSEALKAVQYKDSRDAKLKTNGIVSRAAENLSLYKYPVLVNFMNGFLKNKMRNKDLQQTHSQGFVGRLINPIVYGNKEMGLSGFAFPGMHAWEGVFINVTGITQ